ncbi:calcium and integrin-binding family member 3-like isoform X2 [Gigantopelta aegis]|uniref:calcium and integrin-binding family member 3-like isoform X2 n=1 Tax=Gigantopelta aegis TaxID=1735272 RepID=UPI001B88E0E8|nr:calcium and integrin-binding family member 3-like isoform X2 [Gigantopelta aegis]
MGSKVSSFSDKQLEEYQESTFFTRKEILKIFQRFRNLAPMLIPTDMKGDLECKQRKIPASMVITMPELVNNPFNERICQVFSDDGSGELSFDNFLDMLSVFSEVAPHDMKILYAFKIYDYDNDNVLNRDDLERFVTALTKNELTEEEMHFVVSKVLEEVDMDDDGSLSYLEFEHVMSRATGFEKHYTEA